MKDEKNPIYLFNTTDTELLIQIINSNINPIFLAAKELANRGLDSKGEYVGMLKADELYKNLGDELYKNLGKLI